MRAAEADVVDAGTRHRSYPVERSIENGDNTVEHVGYQTRKERQADERHNVENERQIDYERDGRDSYVVG